MNKLSKKDIILLIISAFSLAYFTRAFFYYTAAMITGSFTNATYCLIGTVSSIAVLISTFAYLKHQYVRPLGKTSRLVLTVLSSLFALVALVFYFMNASIVFGNLFAGVDMYLISVVSLIAILAVLFAGFLSIKNLNKEVKYEERILSSMNKKTITLLVFLGMYAGYGLMCFILNFIVIANIAKYALGYLSVIYLFLLMMFNFVYVIIDSKKQNNKLELADLIANIFGVVLFALAEIIHFNFMCEVAKPFCPIDFAVSVAILPALSILMIVAMIAYFVIVKVSKKKA